VANSPYWDNVNYADAGAVTWGSGTVGAVGLVSAANSLVGSSLNDRVGLNGTTLLNNGNYVVTSKNWNSSLGAVTWGSGTGGLIGPVSAANSLVGSTSNDSVGSGGVTPLTNGDYMVSTTSWKNGAIASAGAATWGSGTVGVSGAVPTGNSLVGTTASDMLGYNSNYNKNGFALPGGNFLVASDSYAGGKGQVLVGSAPPAGVPAGNISFADSTGQALSITASSLTAALAGGTAVTLQASNDITVNSAITVSGTTGGALTMQAGRNINLNASLTTANGNFSAIAGDTGAISADRLAGTPTITLASGTRINAGTGTVTLAAINGNIVNSSGTLAPITTSGAGRWLTYSAAPATDTSAMTTSNKHYNEPYSLTPPGYAALGNWALYSIAPVLTLTPDTLAVTYGTAPVITRTYTGFIGGDSATTAGISGTALYTVGGTKSTSDNYIKGSHEVTYTSGLLSSLGYTFIDKASSLNELTVNAKPLTISAITADNKVYDATTAATVNVVGAIFTGLVTGDVVTVGATGTFATKDVATGKTVTLVNTVAGADLANYTVTNQATTTANISAKQLTSGLSVAASKTYDGTTAATVIGTAALPGSEVAGSGTTADGKPYTGDAVTINPGTVTGTYNSKNVATADTVTFSGVSLTGAQAGNYSLIGNTQAATIAKAPLNVTATTVTKTYDGTLTAVGTGTVGAIAGAGDSVNSAGSEAFLDKNFGTNKTVRASGVTIKDANAVDMSNNYTVTYIDNSASTINKAALTVTATAVTKTYDGTVTAAGAVTVGAIAGSGAGESLSGAGSEAFLDKNFGTNKTVRASGVTIKDAGNADVSSNYTITYVDNSASIINKAALNVTATAITKTYDGTLSTIGTGTVGAIAGAGAGEVVLSAGSEAFLDKNFGIADKTVRASGVTIKDSGNADVSGNYTITYTDNTASTINKAPLNITATNVTKTYDGTLTAIGTGTVGTIAGAGAGEAVLSAGSELFLDKNFGDANKTVRASGVTIKDSGNADVSGNYTITYTDNTVSTINKAALTLTPVSNTKTYDGNIISTAAVTVGGSKAVGDTVTVAEQFASKNVLGTNGSTLGVKPGYTILDAGNVDMSGNYTITDSATATGTITRLNSVTWTGGATGNWVRPCQLGRRRGA